MPMSNARSTFGITEIMTKDLIDDNDQMLMCC